MYKNKYLKYKNKYLELKKSYGGSYIKSYTIDKLLTGDIPLNDIEIFIESTIDDKSKFNILEQTYTFMWNNELHYTDSNFKNRIFDAIINYDFINSAGIIVNYNNSKFTPEKQNAIFQATQDYEPILRSIIHYFIGLDSNKLKILLIEPGNNYPFNPNLKHSIFSLFFNNYFIIIQDLLNFGIIDIDIRYFYCLISKKLMFICDDHNMEKNLDDTISILVNIKRNTNFVIDDEFIQQFFTIEFYNKIENEYENRKYTYDEYLRGNNRNIGLDRYFFEKILETENKLSYTNWKGYDVSYTNSFRAFDNTDTPNMNIDIFMNNLRELKKLLI